MEHEKEGGSVRDEGGASSRDGSGSKKRAGVGDGGGGLQRPSQEEYHAGLTKGRHHHRGYGCVRACVAGEVCGKRRAGFACRILFPPCQNLVISAGGHNKKRGFLEFFIPNAHDLTSKACIQKIVTIGAREEGKRGGGLN